MRSLHARLLAVTAAAIMAICASAIPSAAQAKATRCTVLVNVPFAFQVAGRTFPAGYYRFEQVLGNSDGMDILVVRGLDKGSYQAVPTKAQSMDESRPASAVAFRRSGDSLILVGLSSNSKRAILEVYDAGTKQPMMMAENDVTLPVPSDGELLTMARPVR